MLLASVIVLSSGGMASAEDALDAEALANCMAANSGDAEGTLMKNLLVAALQDDVPGMRSGVADLAAAMIKLATGQCGASFNQLQAPEFEMAGQKYGELLGGRIIEEAFSKL